MAPLINKTTRGLLSIIFISALFVVNIRAEKKEQTLISNCYVIDYSKIRCVNDFNVSGILLHEREQQLVNPQSYFLNDWSERFSHLEIFNASIDVIDEKQMQFHGFTFETLLIENASNLRSIHPQALTSLKERLRDFRAINTSLPNYNDFGNRPHENPFEDFTKLNEVYIGPQSVCPSDETLLFPCECKFGKIWRTVPTGLYGSSGGLSTQFGNTTQITCQSGNLSGEELRAIFVKISKSDHMPKHFDVLSLRGTTNITTVPSDVFSNVSITTVWMSTMNNLKSIHPNAFGCDNSVAKSIQVLQIEDANFTGANSIEVDDIFKAFSSLTNIRLLRLYQCGIPYIPSFAFVPKNTQQQLNNLRYLTLSFDRRKHSNGMKSVGSYAFSGAPNLLELGIVKNFIELFDSYAFAFNRTSNRTLEIDIGGNPFNDTYGLRPNAFSGSQRPVHIKFGIDSFTASDKANDPSLHFMPENVFRPFIEDNPGNYFEVDYFNVNIWCDCGSRWMFNQNGGLKQSVQNGLRIKRVEHNTVRSEPLSIQCKAESTFDCLANCLVFPLAGLIHCNGNKYFDVQKTFEQLALLHGTENIDRLEFSSKAIRELPKDAFDKFEFKQTHFTGCWTLSSIHQESFGQSARTLTEFLAANTSIINYPNFAAFPNLKTIQLDDSRPYHINSSTFDFTYPDEETFSKELHVSIDNGIIDHLTFTKLNNETNIVLSIGESKECSTISCLLQCKPSQLKLEEKIFKPFLEVNPKNQIQTKCFLECSCELQWIYKSWQTVGSQINIWIDEWFGKTFYCVPHGASLDTMDNFFGVDYTQFNYGTYFSENCAKAE